MTYLSFGFFLMVAVAVIIYYIVPAKYRWIVLLITSAYFYYKAVADWKTLIVFASSIIISYGFGIVIFRSVHKSRKKKEKDNTSIILLWIGIVASAFPLFITKANTFIFGAVLHRQAFSLIVPLGLSFYSLQIIAYLVDIYRGKIKAENSFFKYALFISFFPQIVQGPIPRYEQLSEQLFVGGWPDMTTSSGASS